MSVRVTADGVDGYRLLLAYNDLVGWVRDRALGVCGFGTADASIAGAVRAYGVLAAWPQRQHLHSLPELGERPARLVHDGAHRWRPVGRIPVERPPTGTPYGAGADTHASEIVLNGSISEGITIHAALIALRAAHGRIDVVDIDWAARDSGTVVRSSIAPTTHLELGVL